MSNIDTLIKEITSVKYDENLLMESYFSNDHYTYDLMKSNMGKDQYFSYLTNLIKKIQINILNQNKTKQYIELFLDTFYYSKWGEFEESKTILYSFIDVCIEYGFTYKQDVSLLLKWRDDLLNVNEYIDHDFLDFGPGRWKTFFAQRLDRPYKTLYGRFHDEIKALYTQVRDKPETAKKTIKELNKLIKLFSSDTFDSSFCIILTSAISFKYDLLLQQRLIKKTVDEYVSSIHFLIDNKYIYNNYESHFKALEMITKCQYAYNLLNDTTYLYDTYMYLLKDFYKMYDTRTMFFSKIISAEHFQLTLIEAYRVIYYRTKFDYNKEFSYFFDNSALKEAYFTIVLSAWNEFKYRYYKLDLNNLTIEGKYDFIYKLD